MKFNFKEALETLEAKCSQICEREAEAFLKYIIRILKKRNIGFTDIDEIEIYVMEDGKGIYRKYFLEALLKRQDENGGQALSISRDAYKVHNREEAILTITVIENKLKNEGLDCMDTTKNSDIILYGILKSIKIKF